MKVRFTPTARARFLDGVARRKLDGPKVAQRFYDDVRRALRDLKTDPSAGRPIAEMPRLPHRELAVGACRLFYRVEGEKVWIVAAWCEAPLPAAAGPGR